MIPALPKKNEEKKKPDMKDYREREQKVKEKIYKIKDKKVLASISPEINP